MCEKLQKLQSNRAIRISVRDKIPFALTSFLSSSIWKPTEKKNKQTVDTICFVGYSRYNTFYLIAYANNGIIIVSTRMPAMTDAMIFLIFLLYIATPLFLKSLKGCDKMPVLFGLTLIIIVFLRFSKSSGKNARQKSAEFWKREREANLVPAKDLSSLDYLTVPYASLPFHYWMPGPDEPLKTASAPLHTASADFSGTADALPESVQDSTYTLSAEHIAPLSEELSEVEHAICMLSGKRILNLTGITNTELRLTYGTVNLDPLTDYDQNFTALIRALQKWGALLVSSGDYESAITVLSYAVSIGSDIAGTYTLLGRLYKAGGELSKIEALKVSAEQLTTLMKPSILRDLEQLLTEPLHE